MGMYDDVKYECTCPVCHDKVDGFQSKSGPCELKQLETSEADNFYANCNKCGCCLEFNVAKKSNTVFTRTVSGRDHTTMPEHKKTISINE